MRGRRAGPRGRDSRERQRPTAQEERGQVRDVKCYCCGGPNHWAKNCFYRRKRCDTCGETRHLKTMCGKRDPQGRRALKLLVSQEETDEDSTEDTASQDSEKEEDNFLHIGVDSVKEKGEAVPMLLQVVVAGVKVKIEVDTGTFVTVMSLAEHQELLGKVPLKETDKILRTYGNKKLTPAGKLERVRVQYGDTEAKLDLYIMQENGPTLVGRQWLAALHEWPFKLRKLGENSSQINKIKVESIKTALMQQYPRLFDNNVGQYNRGVLKLKLKDGARPVARKAHHTPVALKNKVERELDRLEKLGHIEKVEASKWATSIVPVIKDDKSVRICGNFKLTVNPQLVIDRHPIPLIEEIFLGLSGGEEYSEIDLKHAYMQILVDEESRPYLTIVTHKGCYRYGKLPEGVASGPGD